MASPAPAKGKMDCLDIAVCSVGDDDYVDNSSNHFASDLVMQHSQWVSNLEGEK